jgi:hypothetical protein
MRTAFSVTLATTILSAALLACSGSSDDPSQLLPTEPAGSSDDPLKGGNCNKSHSPFCVDGGSTPAPDAAAPAADAAVADSAPMTKDAAVAVDSAPPPPPPPPPAPTTCTSFTYSAFGACQTNNTQTRTVTSSSPAGCTGGTPVLSQACTYIDGAALYTQYCSNCHGTSKKGSSASAIQSAIDKNTGGMGSLSFLTPAQVAAIAAAP